MRGLIAIARREIAERRAVFIAATIASLVPLAVPLLRGLTGPGAADARSGTALLMSAAFAIGAAVGLGTSMLAPAIASRRIAFDFARPLSGFAIWGGRLVAAGVLAVASAGIVWIPAFLAGARPPWPDLFVDAELASFWPLLFLGGLLAVFAVSHAASVALRSRSPLIALDAALAVGTGLALAAVLSRLPSFLALEPRTRVLWTFALAGGLGLVAAGLASVERGRTDIRAAHRALSLVLWTCVAAALAGIAVYASWVRAATPRDIGDGFWVTPASNGSWVKVQGDARGARASFLYDAATGRAERALVVHSTGPVISPDGSRAAWVEGRTEGGPLEVLALDLGGHGTKARRTRLFLEGYPSLLLLSADGSRLASIEAGVLSLHDLASGRTLVSARVAEDRDDIRGFFIDSDRFRILRQRHVEGKTRLEILELDSRSKRLLETGEMTSEADLYLVADRSGDRIVATRYTDKQVQLLDGRTGTVLATLDEGSRSASPLVGFLGDGRIVLSERTAEALRLHVFRPDGSPAGIIPLATGAYASLGGEVAPGKLVVAVGKGWHCATLLVDFDSGTARKLADDLYPAARMGGFSYEANAAPAVGSEATKLFLRSANELVRLEPVSGEQRVILRSAVTR